MLSWGSKEEEGTDLSTENFYGFLFKNREKQERERSAKKSPDSSTPGENFEASKSCALQQSYFTGGPVPAELPLKTVAVLCTILALVPSTLLSSYLTHSLTFQS